MPQCDELEEINEEQRSNRNYYFNPLVIGIKKRKRGRPTAGQTFAHAMQSYFIREQMKNHPGFLGAMFANKNNTGTTTVDGKVRIKYVQRGTE